MEILARVLMWVSFQIYAFFRTLLDASHDLAYTKSSNGRGGGARRASFLDNRKRTFDSEQKRVRFICFLLQWMFLMNIIVPTNQSAPVAMLT